MSNVTWVPLDVSLGTFQGMISVPAELLATLSGGQTGFLPWLIKAAVSCLCL